MKYSTAKSFCKQPRETEKFVIGNWKMYTTADEARYLSQAIVDGMGIEDSVTVAGSVHLFLICRHCFGQMFGERSAQTLAIHYSGSVNPKNADMLLKRPGVDGVLIGGDSLNAEQFLAIVQAGISQTQSQV